MVDRCQTPRRHLQSTSVRDTFDRRTVPTLPAFRHVLPIILLGPWAAEPGMPLAELSRIQAVHVPSKAVRMVEYVRYAVHT